LLSAGWLMTGWAPGGRVCFMSYEVSVAVQPRRPIAAVAATTTWHRFPGQVAGGCSMRSGPA